MRADLLRVAPGLLGGHVGRRAQDGAGVGLVLVELEPLGQAEVGDLGRAVGGEQDVGRLEVAVDDPPVVRGLHPPREQDDHLHRLARRPGALAEPLGQAAPLDELQGEVREPGVLADLVDLDDARVLELGDRLGLGPEPRELIGRGVGPGQDHLEGDVAVEAELAGLINDAHAAAAQLLDEPIADRPDRPGWGGAVGRPGGGCVERLVVGGGGGAGAGRAEREARSGHVEGRPVAGAGAELGRAGLPGRFGRRSRPGRRRRDPGGADLAGRGRGEGGRVERVVGVALRAVEGRGESEVGLALGRAGPIAGLRLAAPALAPIAVDAFEDRADRVAEAVGQAAEERLDLRLGPAGFVGVPGRLEPLAGRAERPGQFVPGRLDGPVVRLVHGRTPSPGPVGLAGGARIAPHALDLSRTARSGQFPDHPRASAAPIDQPGVSAARHARGTAMILALASCVALLARPEGPAK